MRQPFHVGDRGIPVLGHPPVDLEPAVVQPADSTDGGTTAVVVLERDDQRPVAVQASAPPARPTSPAGSRSSVFDGGIVRCRGHMFSHCALNNSSGSGSSASGGATSPSLRRLQPFPDHPLPPRRPMRRRQPPRLQVVELRSPPAPTTRSADPRPRPRARPTRPSAAPASDRSPTGAPSTTSSSCGCTRSTIVGVNPSSICRDATFHASSTAATLTEYPYTASRARIIHRDPSGRILDLLLPVHLPHLEHHPAAPSPTPAAAAEPPYTPPRCCPVWITSCGSPNRSPCWIRHKISSRSSQDLPSCRAIDQTTVSQTSSPVLVDLEQPGRDQLLPPPQRPPRPLLRKPDELPAQRPHRPRVRNRHQPRPRRIPRHPPQPLQPRHIPPLITLLEPVPFRLQLQRRRQPHLPPAVARLHRRCSGPVYARRPVPSTCPRSHGSPGRIGS